MNIFKSIELRFTCALLLCIALLPPGASTRAAELPTEPILRIEPGEHTGNISRIATDAAGRWLVTASDDKTVGVWDLGDGRRVSTLRVPIGPAYEGMPYAVAMSPDGGTVAVGGYMGWDFEGVHSIYIFDRASGRMLRRFSGLPANAKSDGVLGLPQTVQHLAFSPDGRTLAATLGRSAGLRLFNVADGRLLAEDRPYGGPSSSADFSRDGRLVTTSFDGVVRLYRIEGGALTLLAKQQPPGGKQPVAARFSPDGKRIAVGFYDAPAVNVLDGTTLALLSAPDTTGLKGHLFSVAWSKDGQALFAGGAAERNNQTFIRRWASGGSGASTDWLVANDTITDLVPLPQGRLAFSAGTRWDVLNASGERALSRASVVADFRGSPSALRLAADASQVQFSFEQFGKAPAVFDIATRAFITAQPDKLLAPVLAAPGITIAEWESGGTPLLNGNRLMRGNARSRSLAIFPGGTGFALGTDFLLHAYDANGKGGWVAAAHGPAWAVNVSQDGRWIVAAYGDGTIRWHRASDGHEQLAFYPHPDRRRWVLWSPSGYYDAAPGSEDLIGWHVNRGTEQAADFFPASRFRSRFYRPDVIAGILKVGAEAPALQLANEQAGRRTQSVAILQALPPVVEILSPQTGGAVSQSKLTLGVAVRTAADAPVKAMRVRVNGLLQPELSASGTGETREITVSVPQGDAEIQVFAENRNGISMPATLRVTGSGAKPKPPAPAPNAAEDLSKPKLYVLAVGVSKYKNPQYDLDLAAKDAQDFSNALIKQRGLLYRDVEVKLLTDAKASKDEVLGGMEWLRGHVTARDVGVLYLAGHGVNDATNNYYFLPYDTDGAQLLRTGVAHNDIRITLANIVGKALFFIDTCHSGNVLGGSKMSATDVNAVVSDLASAENGAVVYTAATGKQLSQEDKTWGNGAFTKALVEGLLGQADFRKNGTITHKGLDYYVSERVKELTHGEQSPVSIAPQGVTDFPIAILKN